MDKEKKLRIGITCGDPAGIGPETIYRLCMDSRMFQETTIVLYCHIDLLTQVKKQFQLDEVVFNVIQQASQAQPGKANVINPKSSSQIILGKPTVESAIMSHWSLETTTEDLKNGYLNAVVTAPLSKAQVMLVDETFVGHTEYYQKHFNEEGALMVLCCDRLKVALATNHVALSGLAEALSKEAILKALKSLENTLRKDFNIVKPRIAVLGLNPHAGESGNIGKEELEIIAPAISAVKNAGVLAFGPYSADGFFGSGQCFQFDAVLAMYHDQGLTGFKAIAMDEGVNYTAGLSVVRTSPGHGTAFDIAPKGEATETGLRNAIYLAVDIVRNREEHRLRGENPLPFSVGIKESPG